MVSHICLFALLLGAKNLLWESHSEQNVFIFGFFFHSGNKLRKELQLLSQAYLALSQDRYIDQCSLGERKHMKGHGQREMQVNS